MKKIILILTVFVISISFALNIFSADTVSDFSNNEAELSIDSEKITGNEITYTVSSNRPFAGTLICALYNDKGVLNNLIFEKNETQNQKWTITANTELDKGMTKMFFWNSLDGRQPQAKAVLSNWDKNKQTVNAYYTGNTKISEVTNDPVFGDYGRLIFPVDTDYYSGDTLKEFRLTWYNYIDSNKTVEITNYLKTHAANGETIFYNIYTD